jgi:hypothetical protein
LQRKRWEGKPKILEENAELKAKIEWLERELMDYYM